MQLKPPCGHVLLLDDQPENVEGGIVIRRKFGVYHHDFTVVAGGSADFGVGDVVIVADPNAGRRIMLDGVVYRIVRVADIVAVAEQERVS